MFEQKISKWIDRYFYSPSASQKLISLALLPFSLIYSLIILAKLSLSKEVKFKIPIISIGNLVLGGTGKTPLTKAIFSLYSPKLKTFIILRGYKRSSKGLVKVCIDGEILCSQTMSGDEAMEYAMSLERANVIVCEDRKLAIKEACKLGAKLVLLDDGFGKFDIFKFNILLKPYIDPSSNFCIPSGVYRYPKSFYKFADFIPCDDIKTTNSITNQSPKMVLVAAIANPSRLAWAQKQCLGAHFFLDHHKFNKQELENILAKYQATSLLVTQKDYVKIHKFSLPISVVELRTDISSNFIHKLDKFIYNYA